MISPDLEKNPSTLLSEWREQIKRFCAVQDLSAGKEEAWHVPFKALLTRFRAWDYLMVHQLSGLRELFILAADLCARTDVPDEIREKVTQFVIWKIMVVTDLPENRDFAERFFEVRRELPIQNQFRRLFINRFIEKEAYSSVLAPLHDVSTEIAIHEQSVPYIFEAEFKSRILELAGLYGEDLSPSH